MYNYPKREIGQRWRVQIFNNEHVESYDFTIYDRLASNNGWKISTSKGTYLFAFDSWWEHTTVNPDAYVMVFLCAKAHDGD